MDDNSEREKERVPVDVLDYLDPAQARHIVRNIIELTERPDGQTMHLDFPVKG